MSGSLQLVRAARARQHLPSPASLPGRRCASSRGGEAAVRASMAAQGSAGGKDAVAAAAAATAVSPTAAGARTAAQLLDNAESQVEQLEKRWDEQAEAHLGPEPATEGEEATIWYFAYGSNINKKVFEGRRMIKPAESLPAVLPGWVLRFSQPGLPYSEPAFAAVERREELGAAGISASAASPGGIDAGSGLPDAHGVAHRITPSQWAYVLETEGASGQDEDHGYKVVEAAARAYDGQQITVLTLTVPPKIKARLQGRDALPSLRYITLIREGAEDHGLAPEYRAWLASLQHYEAVALGQRVGAWLFGGFAFAAIFPVWAAVRLLRRFTRMKAASGDPVGRWMGRYTSAMFAAVHQLHEALRPVLGCGLTGADSGGSSSGRTTC